MQSNDLALVQGLRDTRSTLEGWNRQPGQVIGTWVLGSVVVSLLLLLSVWVVSSLVRADITVFGLPGTTAPHLSDVVRILERNSLVLALHAMACVAGFIAGSSLPQTAARHSGAWRWIHDKAGPLAIAFVIGATTFSLITQSFVLGSTTASLAAHLRIPSGLLLLTLLPHALPELVALFLPLAAWTIASRRGQWHELLAATVVTVAIAVPVLIGAAFVEVYVSPHLTRAVAHPRPTTQHIYIQGAPAVPRAVPGSPAPRPL